jgi:hypothetical protein
VVLVVDSTDLLNRKHLDADAQDGACLTAYPALSCTSSSNSSSSSDDDDGDDDMLPFDAVLTHPHGQPSNVSSVYGSDATAGAFAPGIGGGTDEVTIVTYGTGVMAARAAQRALLPRRVGILEVPCVSAVPHVALAAALAAAAPHAVLFADPCKAATAPLLRFVAELKQRGELGGRARDWALVAAADTYNPLGSTLTFLSAAQVTDAAEALLGPAPAK